MLAPLQPPYPPFVGVLTASLGKRLARVRDVASRSDVPDKRCLQLEFADGSRAKARLLMDEEHAAAWIALRHHIGEKSFLCAVLAQAGRAVLEEWVDGEVLPMDDCPLPLVRDAGAVLACLHRVDVATTQPKDDPITTEFARLEARLEALVGGGGLDAAAASRLRHRAEVSLPASCHGGVAHFDFCGRNLVLHRERGIVSIDHEWMRVDALELDVARALSQWSLVGPARESFLRGYGESGGRASLESLDFWLLCAQVAVAELRHRRNWNDAPAALARLLAWLA